MTVPDWWEATLLALAAFRVWRLLGVDTITEPLRDRVTRVDEYHEGRPQNYRAGLDEFIACPWCLGFWVTVVWWVFWLAWPTGAVWLAVPFAISAAVGVLASK